MFSHNELMEMEARFEELGADVEEYEALEEVIEFYESIQYLEAEGFIEIEDGHIYPKGEECLLTVPPLSA